MWIETKANGEYLNADMIERVTVEDTTLTARMPSGGSMVISTHCQQKRASMPSRLGREESSEETDRTGRSGRVPRGRRGTSATVCQVDYM
jgi:hypothetical protein